MENMGEEEEGGWSCEVRVGYGVRLWKSISKEWNSFYYSFSFVVAYGWRVKFWKDKWCRDKSLYVSFPSLYALVVSSMHGLWIYGFRQGREVIGILISLDL